MVSYPQLLPGGLTEREEMVYNCRDIVCEIAIGRNLNTQCHLAVAILLSATIG